MSILKTAKPRSSVTPTVLWAATVLFVLSAVPAVSLGQEPQKERERAAATSDADGKRATADKPAADDKAQRRRRRRAQQARKKPEKKDAAADTTEATPAEGEVAEGEAVRGQVDATTPAADVEGAAAASASSRADEDGASGGSLRRSNRMEFDPRLIRGETAGSGSVILFDRGTRPLTPLTKKRTRFLSATYDAVLGRGAQATSPAAAEEQLKEEAKKPKKPEAPKDEPEKGGGE